ncbi:MAG: hypothetical protein FWD39_03900 [Clostridiales bacterium]|nr:hypothetical protein [Clostridiales bacterium]
MKFGKYLFVLVLLLVMAASCLTVYAISFALPEAFSSEEELLDSLRAYIDDFPDGKLTEGALRVKLQYRQVILPRITDPEFVLESCGLVDIRSSTMSFGTISGVYSCYYVFVNESGEKIRITIDYGLNAKQIKSHINIHKGHGWFVKEGVYKDVSYLAYKISDNYYCFAMGDLLIIVNDCEPFQESRIDLFTFEETELMLPVKIEKNIFKYVLLFGMFAVIAAVFAIPIIIWSLISNKIKKRKAEIKA